MLARGRWWWVVGSGGGWGSLDEGTGCRLEASESACFCASRVGACRLNRGARSSPGDQDKQASMEGHGADGCMYEGNTPREVAPQALPELSRDTYIYTSNVPPAARQTQPAGPLVSLPCLAQPAPPRFALCCAPTPDSRSSGARLPPTPFEKKENRKTHPQLRPKGPDHEVVVRRGGHELLHVGRVRDARHRCAAPPERPLQLRVHRHEGRGGGGAGGGGGGGARGRPVVRLGVSDGGAPARARSGQPGGTACVRRCRRQKRSWISSMCVRHSGTRCWYVCGVGILVRR